VSIRGEVFGGNFISFELQQISVEFDDLVEGDNGNMSSDANKNISGIVYNYLNLPERITVTGKGTVSYIYDASGNKLQKKIVDGVVITVTTYLGTVVYQNDTLQFFGTQEGRIRPPGSNFINDYYLKDHLGNTRMVIIDAYNVASPILETNSYYPFGLQQKGIGYTQVLASLHNKYTYNGKELQEDLGLDQYAYGARFYDAQIGRWDVADPLSEEGRRFSPSNYGADNPLRFIDPDGMQSVTFQGVDAVEVFKQWQQMGRSEGWDETDGDQDGDEKKKKAPLQDDKKTPKKIDQKTYGEGWESAGENKQINMTVK